MIKIMHLLSFTGMKSHGTFLTLSLFCGCSLAFCPSISSNDYQLHRPWNIGLYHVIDLAPSLNKASIKMA